MPSSTQGPRQAESHDQADTQTPPTPPHRARILLINQYYWPDHASTAQHLSDLAESLVEQGYAVHVLCSRRGSQPGGPPRPRRELHRGVVIHRVGATSLGRASTLRRMTDYLSFHFRAMTRALTLPRFDLVVTLTTPPLLAWIGFLLKKLRGSQHVYWSMDLHPDASIALGRMHPSSRSARALSRMSDWLYRQADRVVVLGAYMAERVQRKGVPLARINTIPVWSRRDEVYPLPRARHPLRQMLGIGDQFIVMYSGNHGLAHTFDAALDAARRLRDRDDILFLFVGDGPRRAEVELASNGAGLPNIRLLDFFPREHLHGLLSLADAHLVTLRPEMAGICVPGKLYGAMASGRPVLFVGPARCEVADTIRAADCGALHAPDDGAGLAHSIVRLAQSPENRDRLGENGLHAFLHEFERETCCARWCWTIADLISETAPTPALAPPHPRPQPPTTSASPRPRTLTVRESRTA